MRVSVATDTLARGAQFIMLCKDHTSIVQVATIRQRGVAVPAPHKDPRGLASCPEIRMIRLESTFPEAAAVPKGHGLLKRRRRVSGTRRFDDNLVRGLLNHQASFSVPSPSMS